MLQMLSGVEAFHSIVITLLYQTINLFKLAVYSVDAIQKLRLKMNVNIAWEF